MNLLYRNAAFVAMLAGVAAIQAQGDPATIDRIIHEGKNRSQIMPRLRYLSKNIGARLTSSPRLTRAEQWALSEFRKIGLKNVHLEKWGEVPVGWDRGPNNRARMIEPFEVEMVFTTPAWTNGTRGAVRGRVMKAPTTMADVEKMKGDLKGAWVLFPAPAFRRPGGAGGAPAAPQGIPEDVQTAIEDAGIAGRIYGSRNELVITSGSWQGKTFENHPGAPRITVRKSDYDRLVRNVDFGRHTVVEISADNRWYRGPVPQHNVIAEIPGTEKPDEVIIVSGHYDTWNGPGSEGTCDNGTGSMTAMEAARILMAAGAKPKRTIRFILWGGEEQGLHGSREYVRQHAAEMDKISAVLVDDGGTNYQGGYVVLPQMKAMMEMAMAPSQRAFPDLPQTLRVAEGPRMPRGGGSDHAPFNVVGVPGFFTMETGRADYNYVHHTQHDHFEMAIPEYLIQSATNHAIVAYNLACADTMLPREPKPTTGGG